MESTKSISEGLLNTDCQAMIESLKNGIINEKLIQQLSKTLQNCLELSEKEARSLGSKIVDIFSKANGIQEFASAENEVRNLFTPEDGRLWLGVYRKNSQQYLEGLRRLEKLSQLGNNSVVLDYGAGNGAMAKGVAEVCPASVVAADVFVPYATDYEVQKLELGESLPWEEAYADLTYVVNVLHHLPREEQENLFLELLRVSKSLFLVESVINDTNRIEVLWGDYFSNRIGRAVAMSADDIPVPGTFRTAQQWDDAFATQGWTKNDEVKKTEGRDSPVVPALHHKALYTKIK